MATQSKTQLLTNVYTLLKRRYKPKLDRNASRLSVLRATVYGICHEDTTREHANQALSRFNDEFFDWNEVRVSSVDEIQENLAGIPEPEQKARNIRRFLRQLFNRTYGFTLDALIKRPLKEALKVLRTYEAFESDYVTATVIQQALGGHAIPIDRSARRALDRLGILESAVPALRSMVERSIPKNRGAEFLDLIEDLVNDTCVEIKPDCVHCELRKICQFAVERKHEAHSAAAGGRSTAGRATKDASKKSQGTRVKATPAKPAQRKAPAKPAKENSRASKSPRDKHRRPK
jgi:endonuclease-3